MVKDLAKPGDWLAKINLKDTYFMAPIDPNHQKYVLFKWQDILYWFQCQPFVSLACSQD